MKRQLATLLLLLLVACSHHAAAEAQQKVEGDRPNIVWIIVDDMSANFACYGETTIETPHVDKLAAEGTKFTNAYVTAPVCSTCRSAFITGMYQTTIGAHHHRSGRGAAKINLPPGIRPIPELFQEAGYHTSITGWPNPRNRSGKTDYNFEWDPEMYDGFDWSERKEGQPFFAQIQLPGGKLRGGSAESAEAFQKKMARHFGARVPHDKIVLAPYYPRHPTILDDWSSYLDSVRETDRVVGEIVARLQSEGVLENTLLLFMTDHGISHARGKQFMYDEGLHVPLVIRGPQITPGKTRTDLVEHIDIAALSLAAAGIPLPSAMQAQNILGPNYKERDAVFSARDRCDETVDLLRSVRTKNFKYIRNFLPRQPHLQPNAYKDKKSVLVALREAHAAGQLNDVQSQIFAESRPNEELYDLQKDPSEVNNLADNPAYNETLVGLRTRLAKWAEQTDDKGRTPESDLMFESDMKVYVDRLTIRKADPAHIKRITDNIQLMREWRAGNY